MENLQSLLLVAALVEAIVETLKPLWDPSEREGLGVKVAALAGGIVVAVLGGVNIFDLVGFPLDFFPALGEYPALVLSGILLSRGANFVNDLLSSAQALPARIAGS